MREHPTIIALLEHPTVRQAGITYMALLVLLSLNTVFNILMRDEDDIDVLAEELVIVYSSHKRTIEGRLKMDVLDRFSPTTYAGFLNEGNSYATLDDIEPLEEYLKKAKRTKVREKSKNGQK